MLNVRIAAGCAVAAVIPLFRSWQLRWGATREEATGALPGDEILPRADVTATRAVAIDAPADRVWPWIAQLGQGRGGLYSYDWLENLVGCDIHSADRVVPQWQRIEVGDEIKLHPDVSLIVLSVQPGRILVVRNEVPTGSTPPPYDFTWAFVLRHAPGGGTRLLVRERYRHVRRWAPLLVEPICVVSFVMSRRMLRGIRSRAEQSAPARSHDVRDLGLSSPDEPRTTVEPIQQR